MTFKSELQRSLWDRADRLPIEFEAGESLEAVLNGHLRAVEAMADTVLLTSILLLDTDGKRLWHAAAPSLPLSYREAIDGGRIGPRAGSCGTAAFEDRSIYVTDIATDPLWSDYRHIALPHGLRACWSTPIHDSLGVLVGTFAVYHLTPRSPTPGEVNSIRLVTGLVAQAIELFRGAPEFRQNTVGQKRRHFAAHKVKADNDRDLATRPVDTIEFLAAIESDFTRLALHIGRAIAASPNCDTGALRRAKKAAQRGAQIAQKMNNPTS